ncbi:hypothetical protein NPIL_74291 [Nephila pilipes]|uniref:Uncharacterized protein n=1 Tax=Nephila pilipes TaxID=299642 RepID=A0A8X6PW95_NEPPI|nr:hypothetical protein NPIL_74291 [Nephila pilipes]
MKNSTCGRGQTIRKGQSPPSGIAPLPTYLHIPAPLEGAKRSIPLLHPGGSFAQRWNILKGPLAIKEGANKSGRICWQRIFDYACRPHSAGLKPRVSLRRGLGAAIKQGRRVCVFVRSRTYIHSEIQKMKRMSNSIDVTSERVCFNDDTKVDSSFSDDAVPLHHFHLGQDIYAAVTYFANAVQIHLRQYGRDHNNRLFLTKKGRRSTSGSTYSQRV